MEPRVKQREPPRVDRSNITVVGAGIFGLWQALTLARAGHRVRLIEASATPFAAAASRWAGAMIAPDCEAEAAIPLIRTLGHEGLQLWRATYPDLICRGSLVVAAPRDRAELARFARLTHGAQAVDADRLSSLEPALAGRFSEALYFADEAHMATPQALSFLLAAVHAAGAEVRFDTVWQPTDGNQGLIIDCRGLAARASLPGLRGVRGERLLLRSAELELRRPVRLLHPRASFYIVPWGEGLHMVGATVVESEDGSTMTVRSALELLGLAYALHPAFGEAEIVEFGAGVRPAFADNIPRAIVRGHIIHVNGAFRHGFLLAPVMAAAVAAYIETGVAREKIMEVSPA
jgi:glycine oxidase